MKYVVFRAVAVFNEAVELPEECVFGRQDGAGCYGDVGVPEEDEITIQHVRNR